MEGREREREGKNLKCYQMAGEQRKIPPRAFTHKNHKVCGSPAKAIGLKTQTGTHEVKKQNKKKTGETKIDKIKIKKQTNKINYKMSMNIFGAVF